MIFIQPEVNDQVNRKKRVPPVRCGSRVGRGGGGGQYQKNEN